MSKKLSSKQMAEIHNHQKRWGVSFEEAKRAVVGGYGSSKAEREAMFAARRVASRTHLDGELAAAMSFLLTGIRR